MFKSFVSARKGSSTFYINKLLQFFFVKITDKSLKALTKK